MRDLQNGLTSEVDAVDEVSWYQTIRDFDDASLYQTWPYDAVGGGRKNLSHLAGLCGSNGRGLEFEGVFDAFRNPLSLCPVRVGETPRYASGKTIRPLRRAAWGN